MVLGHVSFRVSNLEESEKFYLAALAPLGYKEITNVGVAVGLGANGIPDFWLFANKDEKASTGSHVAFTAESREVVDQFHAAALKAGAKDNGAPGLRTYTPTYYAAFIIDLEGNNIEVVHM